ncbi:MAG: helix-turn-helix transcriptional regulator [Candidatus Pacebacteria bacterium]|nr:helix-turn-helix transcriptional regulator [Candidatus Paceibacterota bacterium]
MQEYVVNKVQSLRIGLGLTQEELAGKIGVSRQTVVAIEGASYTPSVLLALKLSRFFKKPVGDIFQIAHEK